MNVPGATTLTEGGQLADTHGGTTPGAAWRKYAVAAGVLFLISDVFAVVAAILYGPAQNNAAYITGSGSDTQVLLGALCEVIVALAVVGTAVALFPVVKRQDEGIALGYVSLRTLEAGIIAVGVVPLLAVVTLRQQLAVAANADPAAIVTLGSALVALFNWSFLVGQGLVVGVNTVLIAYLVYRSRLVPRFIPVLGLVGGPLVFALSAARMFGLSEQISSWAGILVIPIFAWEVTLAIWLIFKGFNASAIASWSAGTETKQVLTTPSRAA